MTNLRTNLVYKMIFLLCCVVKNKKQSQTHRSDRPSSMIISVLQHRSFAYGHMGRREKRDAEEEKKKTK